MNIEQSDHYSHKVFYIHCTHTHIEESSDDSNMQEYGEKEQNLQKIR